MQRNLLVLLLASTLAVLGIWTSPTVGAQASQIEVNVASLHKGIVGVLYTGQTDKKIKLMIESNGKKNTYNLDHVNKLETFPLQHGNGEYTITVLENTVGNKYRVVKKEQVTLNIEDTKFIYLNSIQNVKWDSSMQAIKKAKELTEQVKTDQEKVTRIYQYIIDKISYDAEKASRVASDYLPNIENTFTTGKGICYDYAALFAAMARSVGVPTKLVMGHTTYVDEYHAWNEVYMADTQQWVTIDTTVDAAWKKNNKMYEMIKDKRHYETVFEY